MGGEVIALLSSVFVLEFLFQSFSFKKASRLSISI